MITTATERSFDERDFARCRYCSVMFSENFSESREYIQRCRYPCDIFSFVGGRTSFVSDDPRCSSNDDGDSQHCQWRWGCRVCLCLSVCVCVCNGSPTCSNDALNPPVTNPHAHTYIRTYTHSHKQRFMSLLNRSTCWSMQRRSYTKT